MPLLYHITKYLVKPPTRNPSRAHRHCEEPQRRSNLCQYSKKTTVEIATPLRGLAMTTSVGLEKCEGLPGCELLRIS